MQWEYLVEKDEYLYMGEGNDPLTRLSSILDHLGSMRWELVGWIPGSSDLIVLKRPVLPAQFTAANFYPGEAEANPDRTRRVMYSAEGNEPDDN